jgi:bifunctional DNA primase/polymerase-like protein
MEQPSRWFASPTCDVGLVMRRKVGEPFAIDIDSPGVIERMERETGKTLPATYTVLTKPRSAHHKRHIFFRHTQYSHSVFDKNVNAGEYDLIGTGTRALQVVAEGCVRPDTGEVRTGNGLPIADCPDWLADWLISDSNRLRNERAASERRRRAEVRAVLRQVACDDAAERRKLTGYDKHGREDRYRFLVSKARTLSNAGVAKDRLPAELLAQYVEDYGEIRDDDGNGWPLSELKAKIQSILDNRDLKRGNPPPIRPRMSTGLVIRKQPESVWERRVKIARDFPETVTSTEVYDRLGLDIKKPGDKKVASRVMRAVGFVAKRGRRRAIWEKVRDTEKWARREAGSNLSSFLLLPHHTGSVTVTPESTM